MFLQMEVSRTYEVLLLKKPNLNLIKCQDLPVFRRNGETLNNTMEIQLGKKNPYCKYYRTNLFLQQKTVRKKQREE